jgi:hypothetical protein
MPSSEEVLRGLPKDSDRDAILFISFPFPPENASGSWRPYFFAKYLPKYGFSARVVASSYVAGVERADHIRRVPTAEPRSFAMRCADRAAIIAQRIIPYNEQLPWAPHALCAAQKILQAAPIRAIYSTGPPLVSHMVALQLKLRTRLPWIADFQDPLCGNPFRSRWHGRYYDRALEFALFANANALIANTDTVADLWRKRYPQWVGKMHVLMNGYDPDDAVEPYPLSKRQYSVIGHVGSIYGGRRPDAFLTSLERLIYSGAISANAVRVRFVGDFDNESMGVGRAPFSTLDDKGCLEYDNCRLPLAAARQAMGQLDYLLLLDVNEHNLDLQVPGKVFDYVRIGRPILAFTPNQSPLARLLDKCGIPNRIVYPGDTESVRDQKVMELLHLSSKPTQPSRWFLEGFDASRQTQTMAKILEGL